MPQSFPNGGNVKDVVVFVSQRECQQKSSVELPQSELQPGLILADGEINWMCPCLDGLATGPCGVQFRDAFTCFHRSKAKPQGSDCVKLFDDMQNCMIKHPQTYRKEDLDPKKPPAEKVCKF